MNDSFEQLFAKVEEVKKYVGELGRLDSELTEIREPAERFYNSVVEKYRQEETNINERIRKAEQENENNRAEIVELTRKQLQAEMTGSVFTESGRLAMLKGEVATYPLKIEALEHLRADVVISAADQRKLSEYYASGRAIIIQKQRTKEILSGLLCDIRDRIALNCFATFEYIPGVDEFMQKQFKDLELFRKEETK